jgi:hypothetical protein
MKGYVIMSAAWAYNDEYYYQHEGSPGFAHAVYLDREKAEAEAQRLDLDQVAGLKERRLKELCYDLEDEMDIEDPAKALAELGFDVDPTDLGDSEIPELTGEKAERFLELFPQLSSYTVAEVELNEDGQLELFKRARVAEENFKKVGGMR